MRVQLIGVIVLAVACSASGARAQTTDVFVAADDGMTLRPIARYDGQGWSATCDVSAFGKIGERSARTLVPRIIATGSLRVDPVRRVKPATPEWTGLGPAIRRVFQQREREQSVSAAALASVPMTVDSLWAHGRGSLPQLYFFNASKSVPDSRGDGKERRQGVPADSDLDGDGEVDPPGTLRVDVSGWLRPSTDAQGAGSVTPLGSNGTLSWEQDDDRPEASRRSELNPIAVLRIGERSVWALQGRSGALMWFTLYDVSVSGIRTLVRSIRC